MFLQYGLQKYMKEKMVISSRLKLVSWNINSFRGIGIEIFKNQKYNFKDRFESITAVLDYLIDVKGVTIFALQELEDSIREDVQNYFKSKGMISVFNKYNPDKMAHIFLFAFSPNDYKLLQQDQIYLTLSGAAASYASENPSKDEIRLHNLENDFARSAQKIILKNNLNHEFCVVNTHFGLSNKHKLLAAQKLCGQLVEEKLPLLILGDFNQVDKSKYNTIYQNQIEIFTNNGYHWLSECLNQQNPGGTFLPYPYDIQHLLSPEDLETYSQLIQIFHEIKKKVNQFEIDCHLQCIHKFLLTQIQHLTTIGKSLLDVSFDGIFSKNISVNSNLSCKAYFFEQNKRINPAPSREIINKRATELYTSDTDCPYPSDHFPIYAKLSI